MTNSRSPDYLYQKALGLIDNILPEVIEISEFIYKNPELGFREFKASSALSAYLNKSGFNVTAPFAKLKTAFKASYGSGAVNVGLFAEYDALPKVGHACGHNLIAAVALGAAEVLKHFVGELDISINVFGTPGEEGMGGKIIMLENGGFADLNLAILAHPAPATTKQMIFKAVSQYRLSFTGKQAHASAHPEEGRNAQDAMVITQVALALLRQQLKPGMQIHGVITNPGEAPNIIPGKNEALYYFRADSLSDLNDLENRALNCAYAGALATGCDLEIKKSAPTYLDFIERKQLTKVLLSAAAHPLLHLEVSKSRKHSFVASSDMGNVSHVIPSIHPTFKVDCLNASNHQPEFASACEPKRAKTALRDAIAWMSFFVIELFTRYDYRNILNVKAKP